MTSSYLIFDFGGKEDAAQQARQRVENWQRGFRLGNKLSLRFERAEPGGDEEDAKAAAHIRVIVRVDFSDHEKLSRQRWLERIPADDVFKSAQLETISPGDAAYTVTAEKFETLDDGVPAAPRERR